MAYPTLYPPQVNSPPTELAVAIDATQTTIQVEDASILPDAPNLLVIGHGDYAETVLMTAKAGNNLTVQRAVQSSARAWTKGTLIARNFTAYDHAALQEWTNTNLKYINFLTRIVGAMEPQYVKDGLILHLDGINNTGNGHSNTASIWKNLAGNDDVELIVKSLDWDASSIGFDNTTTPIDWGRWIYYPSDFVTLEIVAMPTALASSGAQVILCNAESGGNVMQINASGKYDTFAYVAPSYLIINTNITAKPLMPIKFSMTYDGSAITAYGDAGLSLMSNSRTGIIKPPVDNTVYGLAANPRGQDALIESFTGRIYSVRVYGRALSADEIAYNAFIDRARFGILSNATP